MTRVKICGLTREEDVEAALRFGADMLGFIHVPGTPRFVDETRLRRLLGLVEGRAQTVVVVQDLAEDQLDHLRNALVFDLYQFHGSEPPEHLTRWKGYKVIHMRDSRPDSDLLTRYGTPFLLDTAVGAARGGTGKTFDWSVLPGIAGDYLVAGGLTPDNAAELVAQYQPWGVDVSSGVEAEKGRKDHTKLKQFIDEVRRASTA